MSHLTLLKQLIKTDRIPTVLLFETLDNGLIEEWSACLFCHSHNHCGTCAPCELIQNQNHPDLHRIKPHENNQSIKIEQIRALTEICYQTPRLADKQMIWIEAADSMNINAANALLKILEEPSPRTHFILTVTNKNVLPKTILSRCWQFDFNQGYELDVLESLKQSAVNEKRQYWHQHFEALLQTIEAYLQKKIDLATLLKQFEAGTIDDVLWVLQHVSIWFLTQRMRPKETYTSQHLSYLCAIPLQWWWTFWDALLDYRKKSRLQNLQLNVLLTRLFLILNGAK
jgi:DNA polymerase III delta prime subunit